MSRLAQFKEWQKNTDKGLQYLIDDAYRILGNPIILYDIDWKVLAYSKEAVTDDFLWNTHLKHGLAHKNLNDFIYQEGFFDIIAGPLKIVMLKSEQLNYDRILAKIFAEEDAIIACVSVVASNKIFSSDDLVFVEAICKIFSKEITKLEEYKNYGQKKSEQLIRELINGDLKNNPFALVYTEAIYWRLKSYMYIAVADIPQNLLEQKGLDYYMDLFRKTRPAFKYTTYSGQIVIIMSTSENKEVFNPKKSLNHLNRIIQQNNIKVGISSHFENIYEMPRYYDEAIKALNDGLKDGCKNIFMYKG